MVRIVIQFFKQNNLFYKFFYNSLNYRLFPSFVRYNIRDSL